jgi:hypothetical protein
MSQLSALTFAGCSGTSFALYYALKLLLPPAYWPLALLLIAAALGGLYFMSYKVAPKPASPPAVGAAGGGAAQQPPSLDFHRTLLPRPAAKYQYHWQQPLPSTAPASRTTTAESAGSQWGGGSSSGHTGTDMTGPEDLTVSLGAQRQWQGGAGEGGAGGGDGLRRRAGAGQREAGAGGVGLLGGGSSSSSSAEQPPVAYRKLYTGRSAGRLERIKAAKAARASATAEDSAAAASAAAAAPTSPGSPPSTMATVRVVGEGEEGEEGEEEESSARLEELEEEQRWAEQVSAVEGDAAASSSSSSSSSSGSPMDADARALFKLMRGLGLDSFFPALRAEALASLSLLQSLAAADPERVRRVLREAGMGKVGNREALVLALAPPGSRKSVSGGSSSSSSQPPVEQLPQGRLPGVKDEGVRAALGRLSVSANEAGAEMPLLVRGPHASASTAGLAGLAPLM